MSLYLQLSPSSGAHRFMCHHRMTQGNKNTAKGVDAFNFMVSCACDNDM